MKEGNYILVFVCFLTFLLGVILRDKVFILSTPDLIIVREYLYQAIRVLVGAIVFFSFIGVICKFVGILRR